MRGVTDVNVSARGRARHGLAESYEWDARAAEVGHYRLAFDAVRVHGDVNRIAVIEAEPVMHLCLAQGADRKGAAEAGKEEALYF